MNVQEKLRINGYQPTVGYPGTDMGIFQGLMDRYKCECSPFMLSVAYTWSNSRKEKNASEEKIKKWVTRRGYFRDIMVA